MICVQNVIESGSGLGNEAKQTWPADIQVNNWDVNCRPAAFDLAESSPLKPDIVSDVGHMAGSSAAATKQHKLDENSGICNELCLNCVPIVVETFRASNTFSKLVSSQFKLTLPDLPFLVIYMYTCLLKCESIPCTGWTQYQPQFSWLTNYIT